MPEKNNFIVFKLSALFLPFLPTLFTINTVVGVYQVPSALLGYRFLNGTGNKMLIT